MTPIDGSAIYMMLSCFGMLLSTTALVYGLYIKFSRFVGRDRGMND